jgi:Flp pilus assembly protein TadG
VTNKIAAIFRRLRHHRQGERGQTLILFAAGLAGFLGLVGLSIDVGQIMTTRTDLQKVADAAALAGAQDLTNATAAKGTAQEYVQRNGGADTAAEIVVSKTYGSNDTIEVKAKRRVNFTFLRAVGLGGTDVDASARVRIASYSGGTGLLPWGFVTRQDNNSDLIQNECYEGMGPGGVPIFTTNVNCTIKYGAGASGHAQGDFGALALDGTGVSDYRDAIKHGSKKGYEVGDKVEPQTGDFGLNTISALEQRLAQPLPENCQTNDPSQVLIAGANGTVSINPDCYGHPRIGIIPVVDQIDDPNKSTILGFAFVWIDGIDGKQPGKQEVNVKFLTFVREIPGGYYNGDGTTGPRVVRLIE